MLPPLRVNLLRYAHISRFRVGSTSCIAARLRMSTEAAASERNLSSEQMAAANKVLDGSGNVFITGSAGTGKTFLLRHIIAELRRKHGVHAVAVTAATGVAAAHIQGTTLHSFAGIGIGIRGEKTVQEFVKSTLRTKKAKDKWKSIEYLIIDEISMIDSDIFTLLDRLARAARKDRKSEAFGGVKLVICGDFFQLPPVQLGKPVWKDDVSISSNTHKRFAFDSQAWRDCYIAVEELVQPQRHHEDLEYARILRECRRGVLSPEALKALQACHVSNKPPAPVGGIVPTRLYCHNIDVDSQNDKYLAELPGNERVSYAMDRWVRAPGGVVVPFWRRDEEILVEEPIAAIAKVARAALSSTPETVRLKVGAQVSIRCPPLPSPSSLLFLTINNVYVQ
jgi:hypothetical protein